MDIKLVIPLIVICAACCSTDNAAQTDGPLVPPPAGAGRDTAAELVRNMGIGMNIGNTLDCIGTANWIAGETGWGNPVITRDFIQAIRRYGYKTIRLPVTWAEHLGGAPDYHIEESWMARVEEVVGWILDEGMYCIVNLHHDGGESDRSWILDAASDSDSVTARLGSVWRQIANRFVNASDYLVFEAMNEVGFNSLPIADAQRLLTRLNQAFVDAVRNTGGINTSRFLLVSGYYTDIDRTCDSLFQMPVDTQTDRLILSVHYYTPATFCIAEERNNSWGFRDDWGTDADYAELTRQINKLKAPFVSKGTPVILGEYGVTKKNKVEAGRIKWMAAVTRICFDNGICPVLWDTGGEISRYAPYAMSDSLKTVYGSLK